MAQSPPRSIEEGQSVSGSVNSVKRIGDTVIRPAGTWSKAVHQLLRHLASVGFVFSPKAVSLSSDREVLSYIEGEVAMRPWPICLQEEEGIVAVAQMLLTYHQAVTNYVPEPNSVWRVPDVQWKEGMMGLFALPPEKAQSTLRRLRLALKIIAPIAA